MSADPDRWTLESTERGYMYLYDGGTQIGIWAAPSPDLRAQLEALVASANRPVPPPDRAVDWMTVAGMRLDEIKLLWGQLKEARVRISHMVEVGDDSPVVSATVVDVLTEKIDGQQIEIADLTARLGDSGKYVSKRYEQAKAVVGRMRQLAAEYDRILDGPLKD